MKLTELVSPWVDASAKDCAISGLANDSRAVKAGDLFIAYPGANSDGRLFINQALAAGAKAVIFEPAHWPAQAPAISQIPGIAFPQVAQHLAAIASRFYQYPAQHMTITGVTGTNGKTTIAYQLAQAHSLLGQQAAYIGTLGEGLTSQLQPLANTTPDALALQALFSRYLQNDIQHVCMEVSSHALHQGRVNEILFKQALFTNLTHDHLDYHPSMEAYAQAKALLFANPALEHAIINQDDAYAKHMAAVIPSTCQLVTYGTQEGAAVRALSWEVHLDGSNLQVQSPWGIHDLHIQALGFFNIYNALAVFTSLLAAGYAPDAVVKVMAALRAAPGRMEVVAQKPYAIVDYAHTPDALENVLATLSKVKKGKIIAVFGCGGDRDKTKRPMMGKIAGDYADVAIITSDNPRSEDPKQIIQEIEQGINTSNPCYKISDRKQAIAKALELADSQDIVLIAGKGHETYQQIGQTRHHFSDQEVVRALLGKSQ